MLTFPAGRIVAIGEAMVEMAPVGEGLYRRGYAGDTFNTVWHMAQLLGDAARSGFVTRVGRDGLSDSFRRRDGGRRPGRLGGDPRPRTRHGACT